jgi:hypothetical protein
MKFQYLRLEHSGREQVDGHMLFELKLSQITYISYAFVCSMHPPEIYQR